MWGKKIKKLMIRLIVKKLALLYDSVNLGVRSLSKAVRFRRSRLLGLQIDTHQEITNLRLVAFRRQYHLSVLSYNDIMTWIVKLTISYLSL